MTQLGFDALEPSRRGPGADRQPSPPVETGPSPDPAPGHDGRDDDALRTIRESLTETLFVEAGAGTGKTSALVDRIVALVRSGVAIERIAAITFTDRAAAELRERVRGGLEDALPRHPDEADVIQTALDSLDRAQISTIHAFCQSIVRTYAAEAGVDPDFDVQDELRTTRRMQERWRSFLEHLGEDEAAVRAIDRVLSLGLRTNELEDLALSLASRGEIAELLEPNPLTAPEPGWPDVEAMLESIRFLHLDSVAMGDKLREDAIGVRNIVEAMAARPESEREEILAAGAAALKKPRVGSKNNWGSEDARGHAFEVIEGVVATLNTLLAGLRSAALAGVMPYVLGFVREDEHARGQEGELTFDDLILRTRRLLSTDAEAVASLRRRLDVLLIDEFQDTDPLQVQIATAFGTDPATGRLESGRLFLVGDPKQSIYRFRRADMATYAHTRDVMSHAGARLPQLALNRRSRNVILGWVNSVFDAMISTRHTDAGADVQPPYNAIFPVRDIELAGPGVGVFGGQLDKLAREARVQEAGEVAALCRMAVEERWQVAERTDDGWKPREAAFRDIAILIPRRTGLTALERALAGAGVPYRVEGGSLIYRTQEVRDLLNCLAAVDNPADEVAVVAALRSPAFACSDVDLARHRATGGRFNYHHPDLGAWDGPVADGLRALAEFHKVRHESSLAALVERIVLDRGLVETGILDQGDRNSFRRARFMTERARAFEAAGPESLRAFVSWLEQQSEAAMLDNEGAGLDDDEDAVRVLTIHGAKGLEFPIVIMSGMAADVQNRPPPYTADFTGERVAVAIGHKTANRRFTLGEFDALTAAEAAHAHAEFDRMLYVAATRARDHLVVSLNHHARSNNCAAQRLIACGAEDATRLTPARIGGGRAWLPLAGLTVDVPAGVEGATFAEQREALVAAAKTVAYTSATAIGQFAKNETTDETEPWARGRGGTRLGRAVHAAVQSLPLDADDAAIAGVARAQAVAEAIPHREADVRRLVRWIVRESEAWQRARGAVRAMREVPFALQSNGTVLEGFIDLVVQTDDGVEIIDWKTDQISPGDVPERLKEYELQAGLYVHGLESATAIKVRRVTYVFAGAKVEESPGEPGELANAARIQLDLLPR